MSADDENVLTELQLELERARQQAKDLREQLAAGFEDQAREHDGDRLDPAARRREGQGDHDK